MDQQPQISALSEPRSLASAKADIRTIQESVGSLGGSGLVDALARLQRAYGEFPELELDHPRGELLKCLRSAAPNLPDRDAVILLIYCIALDPSCSGCVTALFDKIAQSGSWPMFAPALGLLCRFREFPWSGLQPIVNGLRQQGRADTLLQVIAQVLGPIKITSAASMAECGELLSELLSDDQPIETDNAAFAEAARSARHRLRQPPRDRHRQGSRAALLAMAQRLRAGPAPRRAERRAAAGWPSGRLSFDEFLLQWPCEVELPSELDETALIEQAYRAILLRMPDATETSQYLRLLHDGGFSKISIIEDLLGSEELRSLERRVRVIWGDLVLTAPGSSREKDMPAVIWPCGPEK